jgi:lysophospholipase
MPVSPAPFFEDVAGGPPTGAACWVKTSDDVRIRVGHWHPAKSARGTVLMFPGRTEYIEKYADTAREMAARGFAMLAIDWRGQGLADRLLADHRLGHVVHFTDYQKDIAAALRAARELDLPRPFHLLAHSMGGAIGLRAVMEGLSVQSCVFTGPMWGINVPPLKRPASWAMAHGAPLFGRGAYLMPSTSYESYVLEAPFQGNFLTTDQGMYRMMQAQLRAHPDLGLGGPSVQWMSQALQECRLLGGRASPDVPCLTFLGTREKIVALHAVRERMKDWPRGTLEQVSGAEHEVLMETPKIRAHVYERIDNLFSGAPDSTP